MIWIVGRWIISRQIISVNEFDSCFLWAVVLDEAQTGGAYGARGIIKLSFKMGSVLNYQMWSIYPVSVWDVFPCCFLCEVSRRSVFLCDLCSICVLLCINWTEKIFHLELYGYEMFLKFHFISLHLEIKIEKSLDFSNWNTI